MSSESPRRSGRRRGPTATREAIATAARAQFAELGFDRTTVRGIAAAAGVDPALVVHFFGSKDALFREVLALPPEMGEAMAALAEGPREEIGRRLAYLVAAALENPVTQEIVVARIRGATSHPHAAEVVRETVTRDLHRLASALTDDQPDVRAALVGSQVVGIAFARHVARLEPLVSMSLEELAAALAPTFQRYLVEPLA
jgi:AcrR family transcriptional regulator